MKLSNRRQHVVGTESHNIDEGKGIHDKADDMVIQFRG